MDEIVKLAIDHLREAHGDREWILLPPSEQTVLIYREIRRLDLERVEKRQTPEPSKDV